MTGDRPGLHRRRGSPPTVSGCCGPSRPRACSAPTPARELAPVPLRVGLITSDGSAAYHDFVDELLRSPYAWHVGVVDVAVQSAGAAQRIKWALGRLAQLDVDVVVLARGGGSRADLAPFDTELVARAIAAMACTGVHRRRPRGRPQRRRRGRAHRVQDPDRVRAAARPTGRRVRRRARPRVPARGGAGTPAHGRRRS